VEMSAVKDKLITIKASLAKALRIPVKEVDIKNFVAKPDGTVIQFVKPISTMAMALLVLKTYTKIR